MVMPSWLTASSFQADDLRNPAEIAAVISDGFWSRRFGRDASAIGKHISLNQVPVTIVGINPPEFHGMEPGQNPDVSSRSALSPRFCPTSGPQIRPAVCLMIPIPGSSKS
jgi:MacB-like periplasmic core domain